MSPAEAATRADLASLYHLVAHFRMTDLVDTHISARIPGTEDQFLINPYGVLFHEVTAEELVKINPSGVVLDNSGRVDGAAQKINTAGFTIHSAIHMARHDLACVVHTHTADGIAVSCQQNGLLPISQHALKFYEHLGYHTYEGIAFDLGERERLVASLGPHSAMILRNHGLIAGGGSIPEAFVNIYYLERACQAQVKALAGNAELTYPSHDVCKRTAARFNRKESAAYAQMVWASAKRLLL